MKYEGKKKKSTVMFLMINIEWGQIDPKDNRRVKSFQYSTLVVCPCFSSHLSISPINVQNLNIAIKKLVMETPIFFENPLKYH